MRGFLAVVLGAAIAIVIAAALGVHAPHHVSPFAGGSSATIGTSACPGSTSAAGTTPGAHRKEGR